MIGWEIEGITWRKKKKIENQEVKCSREKGEDKKGEDILRVWGTGPPLSATTAPDLKVLHDNSFRLHLVSVDLDRHRTVRCGHALDFWQVWSTDPEYAAPQCVWCRRSFVRVHWKRTTACANLEVHMRWRHNAHLVGGANSQSKKKAVPSGHKDGTRWSCSVLSTSLAHPELLEWSGTSTTVSASKRTRTTSSRRLVLVYSPRKTQIASKISRSHTAFSSRQWRLRMNLKATFQSVAPTRTADQFSVYSFSKCLLFQPFCCCCRQKSTGHGLILKSFFYCLTTLVSTKPKWSHAQSSKTDHFLKLAPFRSPLTDLIDFGMAGI